MKLKKIEQLIWDIYRDLYKNSTPSVNFDELVENATLNERGEKVIPFMDYYIDQDKMDEIVESHLKRKRLSEWEIKGIKFQVYLGCSPTSNRTKSHE